MQGSSAGSFDLWDLGAAGQSDYHEAAPSDEVIRSIESELGYRLPATYVSLARSYNGGLLRRNAHASPSPTTWAADHVALTGIFAIGRTAPSKLVRPKRCATLASGMGLSSPRRVLR
jgi:hypothetical protein